jgi:uncharacterized membrane protein
VPAEPTSDLAPILQRLAAIEQRLNQLEAGLPPRNGAVAEKLLPPQGVAPAAAEPAAATADDIPTVLPADESVVIRPSDGAPLLPTAAAEAAPPPSDGGHHESTYQRVKKTAPPPTGGGLEQAIGLKWAGWLGAIVLVIGVGLAIKFAYDQGWFGQLPVAVRLALMSLVGFGLLAAGEVVYRRVDFIAAVGLFGAGVAVLFLISYAGNVYYGAYSYQTAFAFAVLTTLIGSGVAIRGRLVSIAVLAQIGGQLGPLVLSTGQPPGLALLAYVLMLELVALILALWGRTPKWWVLRAVSLAGTALWVSVALAQGHWAPGLANEVLWFAVLYAAGYQGELLRSALRAGEDDDGRARAVPPGLGAIFSLCVTAGLTAVALDVFYAHDSAALRGGSTLVLAALCLGAGFLLQPGGNPLVQALAVSYRVQGLALVILFVPVTLSGVWICLAWGVLSLAFATLGARFDRDLARAAALGTWLLALGRLLIDAANASSGGPAGATWLVLLAHPVKGYTVLGWLLAGAGLLVAWLLQHRLDPPEGARPELWRQLAVCASILASLVWSIVTVTGLPPLGATLSLVLWAWLLVGVDYAPQRLGLAVHALVLLGLAACQWVTADAIDYRMSSRWKALEYYPVFNPIMGLGALLAVSLAGTAWLRRDSLERTLTAAGGRPVPLQYWAWAVAAVAVGLVTLGLSFEVDRLVERLTALGYDLGWPPGQVKLFGLTLLWLAIILVAALGRDRLAIPAAVVWLLVLLVAGKFLLVDMLLGRLAGFDPGPLPGPAPVLPFLNLQVLTAVAVLAGLLVLPRLAPLEAAGAEPARVFRLLANLLALLIVLLAETLEIDRVFSGRLAGSLRDPELAKQVAMSIFWSLFALAAVVAGFRWRAAWLRYFGLVLFGVTLIKVLLADLSQVQFGYRILSLVGLGLLLLATSVLYGRLSPKLLGEAAAEDEVADVSGPGRSAPR